MTGSVLSYVEDQLAKADASSKGLGHCAADGYEKCGLDIDQWLSKATTENGYGSPYLRGYTDDLYSISPEVRDFEIINFSALASNFDTVGSNLKMDN